MREKRKLGFFFGAGSEIGYGLPSGGRFALDIFKISKDEDKEAFKQQLLNIDLQSQISTKWLPENFKTKSLYVFGKGNFEEMISSSLENRRGSIRDYLDNFDDNVTHLLADWDVDQATVERKFVEAAGSELGEKLYSREVVLNRKLAPSVPLFESEYFSALLKLFELDPTSELRKVITAILELLLGALGQSLVSHLNDELFEKAPSNMNIFDDLSSIFNMNYAVVGNVGLELVIREQREKVDEQTEPYKLFTELGKTILEQIYCQTLDYQSLIDSHFRYLYSPKSHWAKFTRIAIFLNTVQRYDGKKQTVSRIPKNKTQT